jgi:hypothetical protein
MELEVQFEWIAGISRHKLGSEALHRSQIFLRHFDEVVFATKGMRKVAAIHSDPPRRATSQVAGTACNRSGPHVHSLGQRAIASRQA